MYLSPHLQGAVVSTNGTGIHFPYFLSAGYIPRSSEDRSHLGSIEESPRECYAKISMYLRLSDETNHKTAGISIPLFRAIF
jgi:hypothetical protein